MRVDTGGYQQVPYMNLYAGCVYLTFNITYFSPVFQNLRNILEKLHILLTPDQGHNVFQCSPVLEFHNGKCLKDQLVRAKLPSVEITGSSESLGKGNCQVCDFICNTDTFSAKACGETLKIHSGTVNCNSQKVVYLLKCKVCGEAPDVGRAN